MELNQQLTPKLKQLRLSGVLATLEARHRQAIDAQWAYVEFLERLLEDEIERRAHEACRQGCDVLFVNTHKRLQHLHGGRADGTWAKRLSAYLRPELLVLDDFGLKPLVDPAPSDLHDVINERYETGSILVTSNRAPAVWPDLFGNPLLAAAGLDRLAHHAETLVITGRSFRAQGRQLAEKPPTKPAKERR
jgi:DNA replication protein DnaC